MVATALPPLHPNHPVSWVQPAPKLTDGSVSSYRLIADGGTGALETVMVTGDEVVWLPAASRAMAVSVCEPLLAVVVSQEIEYGAFASSAPLLTPSNRNWTPATPRLSDAVAVTVIVPETVAPEAGDVMLTVGGLVSGLGHVRPGMHGNWAEACGANQAPPAIRIAAKLRRQKFIMAIPLSNAM